MSELIKPKELVVKDSEGNEHKYIIGKVPFFPYGERLIAELPASFLPKFGDTETRHELMMAMFSCVIHIDDEGDQFQLETQSLVNNHIAEPAMNGEILWEVFKYSTNFTQTGKYQEFLAISQQVKAIASVCSLDRLTELYLLLDSPREES